MRRTIPSNLASRPRTASRSLPGAAAVVLARIAHRAAAHWLGLVLLVSFASLARPGPAGGACNVIPAALTTFRGVVGSTTQPFASPGDWLSLVLDGRCDGETSPGFPADTGPVVTIVFAPPSGPRSVIVLSHDCESLSGSLAACGSRPGVAAVVCRDVDRPGRLPLVHRVDQRTLQLRFPDSDGMLRTCEGGPSGGQPCLTDAACGEGGICASGLNDGLTLAGPAAIAVTAAGDPIPCDVVGEGCTRRSGLLACVDRIFAADGSCSGPPHATFSHFTALPPPNAYSSLCTAPTPPCTPTADRSLRFAVDLAGNMLAPMDWRGILVDRDAVPVARLLRGRTSIEAFPGRGVPLLASDPSVLASYSPQGVRIPPIFDLQADPTDLDAATFFGTADAPATVLRIARHDVVSRQCAGGPNDELPCIVASDCPGGECVSATCFAAGRATTTPCGSDGDCPGGECGPPLFDFASRRVAGVGPVLAPTSDVVALDPVPLDGLSQTEVLNALVADEALSGADANGDRDATDRVVRLADRATGAVPRLRPAHAEGRAVARVRQGRFTFPAVAASQDVLAFLEPEDAQGNQDRSANGRTLESVLRAFRLQGSTAAPLLSQRKLVVDAAPLVNRRSLALVGDRLLVRLSETGSVPQTTVRISVSSTGGRANGDSYAASLSGDGRFVAFASDADNVVDGDTNDRIDVFVRDRDADGNGTFDDPGGATTARVSVSSTGEQANSSSAPFRGPAISRDGRFVAFGSFATNLVPGDANGTKTDVFVRDRDADADGVFDEPGEVATTAVSVSTAGEWGNGFSDAPAISADGRFVVFQSNASNLVAETAPLCPGGILGNTMAPCTHVYLRDRDVDGNGVFDEPGGVATTRASVTGSGEPADLGGYDPNISADGGSIVFVSPARNLVPDPPGRRAQVYVRDRERGTTIRASVSSTGEPAIDENGIPVFPTISADGRFVAFQNIAANLVPGDTNDEYDVFVRDRDPDEDGRFDEPGEAFTQRVSVSSTGEQGEESIDRSTSSFLASISADGRFVAFLSLATNLVRKDTNGTTDTFLHDRLTGQTVRTSVSHSGGQANARSEYPSSSPVSSISGDGRYVAFESRATNLTPGAPDFGRLFDVFVRGPRDSRADVEAVDRSGNGRLDDTVLASIDARSQTVDVLCPAGEVLAQPSGVAFIRPESAGAAPGATVTCPGGTPAGRGVDLNGDGDSQDGVVHDWPGSGSVRNLGLAASKIALSDRLLAARVPEILQAGSTEFGDGRLNADGDSDDAVAFVRRLPDGEWRNLGHAAGAIAASGPVVAFAIPEAAEGAGSLNDDADEDDDVLAVYDDTTGGVRVLGRQAEDFVVGPTGVVAFRTLESAEGGRSLNGDSDAEDGVLQLFTPGMTRPLNTGIAVTPCRLEACDPRAPYRVLKDTVKFLTFECDQGGPVTEGCPSGGTDLDGDGRADHLVLQMLNVPLAVELAEQQATGASRAGFESSRAASTGDATAPARHVLAAATAGVCTSDGDACARDADCRERGGSGGVCFVPPGGCVRDLESPCTPGASPPQPGSCPPGQFCQPTADGEGTCRLSESRCRGGARDGDACAGSEDATSCPGGTCSTQCASSDDCRPGAECNVVGQDIQRLIDPLLAADADGGTSVLVGAGRCVERLDAACTASADCGPGAFCADGTCQREQGPCRACAAGAAECTRCPGDATCERDLVVQTALDADADELPDAVDNCPLAPNVLQQDLDADGLGDACDAQTCGNGIVEADETCDDGNLTPQDECTCTSLCSPASGGILEKPRLTITSVGGASGVRNLAFRGRMRLPVGVADDEALAELIADGVQVLVEDVGRGSTLLDLSRRVAAIPGPSQEGCAPADDVWRIAPDGRSATYTNGSGELPAAGCEPASARGLRSLTLDDRRAAGGAIRVLLQVRASLFDAPIGPLRIRFVLGSAEARSLQGRCGVRDFATTDCAAVPGSARYRCLPRQR